MTVDFADIKPGVLNFFLFCAYYLLAKVILRMLFAKDGGKFYVAGVSDIVSA